MVRFCESVKLKKNDMHNSVNPFCKYTFEYAHAEKHMQADI